MQVPVEWFLALLAAVSTALGWVGRAFIRGDLVPGKLHRTEVERANLATTQAQRTTEALTAMTATLTEASRELARRLDAIERRLAELADDARWDNRDRFAIGGPDRDPADR